MSEKTTVTLFIDSDGTRHSSQGSSSVGFDWGENFTATADPEEATRHAEEIEIELDEYVLCDVAEKCELCERTEALLLVAALRRYAAIREWLREHGYITQDTYDEDRDSPWGNFQALDDSEFEDEHSDDGGNIGLFLTTLKEVHGSECAVEQAAALAKSKKGCPDAVNWLASRVRPNGGLI